MARLECPHSLAEPPTCNGPDQCSTLTFRVYGFDYDTDSGPEVEMTEQDCTCEFTEDEIVDLEARAIEQEYNL